VFDKKIWSWSSDSRCPVAVVFVDVEEELAVLHTVDGDDRNVPNRISCV
jgi:hypothetical protein